MALVDKLKMNTGISTFHQANMLVDKTFAYEKANEELEAKAILKKGVARSGFTEA